MGGLRKCRDWRVVLTPRMREAYTYPATLFYRIAKLDFEKSTYPDIVINSANPQ